MLSVVSGDRTPRVHFSGIGGTGMVAVARLAIEAGWEVRGSDNPLYPPTSDMVRALDVPLAEGYAAKNLDWEPDVVVIGNALSRGNEEVEAVLEHGIQYMSYPEWLKFAVLQSRHSIVVTGTHGKTTTTALAAHFLDHAGKSPGFLIGGQTDNFAHSSYLGAVGGPFVIEGDEYDTAFFDKRAKFFHYLPRTAVVTSLEFDHGDIYADIESIEAAFRFMLRQIPATGRLILCADSPRAAALSEHAFCEVTTYGFSGTADWCLEEGSQEGNLNAFKVFHADRLFGEFKSPLFGRHNLQNTLAAIIIAEEQGVTAKEIAAALLDFKGVRRRMDLFLKSDGILFIDDFAHHPTAIRETIAAVHNRWPGERLTVLFEPRSNTTATNQFQDELGVAFRGAAEVWIGPIYRADRYAEDKLLDRHKLVEDIEHEGAIGHVTDNVEEIVRHLREDVRTHDVVLIFSNGAFDGLYDYIKAEFTSQEDA